MVSYFPGITRAESGPRIGLRLNLSAIPPGPSSDDCESSVSTRRKHILSFNTSPGEKIDPNVSLDQQG